MTTEPRVISAAAESATPEASAAALKPTRPFYWSVRRELWDHRAVWLAPLITAGLLLFMYVLIMTVMARPGRVPRLPYEIAPNFMAVVMALVWLFYCLDALHGERRDRSILFWKSLPVSDRTTVFSKAATALLVLPIVTFVITAALQLGLWLAHQALGLLVGVPLESRGPFPLISTWGIALYGFAAMTLWLAPVCAWCLLVSGWARRAPLVWSALPMMAIGKLETVVFRTTHVSGRWVSWCGEAFAAVPSGGLLIDPAIAITPARFLSSASLWIGLVIAGLFLVAAAEMRRRRSPL